MSAIQNLRGHSLTKSDFPDKISAPYNNQVPYDYRHIAALFGFTDNC
jgi:hypothetical protein